MVGMNTSSRCSSLMNMLPTNQLPDTLPLSVSGSVPGKWRDDGFFVWYR